MVLCIGITWLIIGGGGGAESTMGVRNFNLLRSQVRKMGKICLNQSVIYLHTSPPLLCKFHTFLTKLFLSIKNIGGAFAPLAPCKLHLWCYDCMPHCARSTLGSVSNCVCQYSEQLCQLLSQSPSDGGSASLKTMDMNPFLHGCSPKNTLLYEDIIIALKYFLCFKQCDCEECRM